MSNFTNDIEASVRDRDTRHGLFHEQAVISEGIQLLLMDQLCHNKQFLALPGGTRAQISQAIKMISVKLSRAACGNPAEADIPFDISGYALLWSEALCMTPAKTYVEQAEDLKAYYANKTPSKG